MLTYITRLWPILLLVILGIFVAALRLLFLSSQKVEPVRPLPTLSPPRQPPTEKDLQSAAYTIIQCRVTQILRAKFPEVRWVWENPRAMEDILAGKATVSAAKAAIDHRDFVGKYQLTGGRKLSILEESLVPKLEDWYIMRASRFVL